MSGFMHSVYTLQTCSASGRYMGRVCASYSVAYYALESCCSDPCSNTRGLLAPLMRRPRLTSDGKAVAGPSQLFLPAGGPVLDVRPGCWVSGFGLCGLYEAASCHFGSCIFFFLFFGWASDKLNQGWAMLLSFPLVDVSLCL